MDHDIALHGAAQAAAFWTALCLLFLLVMSLLVVRQRQKHHVVFGDNSDIPELSQAIRAFGNAAEYLPAGLAGLIALAVVSSPPLAIHIAGALLFSGRVSHGVGLSLTGGPSMLRTAGMLLTWTAYIFAAVALLIFAVT